MTEQNQHFHSHIQPNEPPALTPSHKLIKKKLCQLQNKAFFFEGQLNPLVGDNQKLKAQLTLLNKAVIASTDLLRSLLPIGSCETKRLKLQLASIEQICQMIREDWYMMQDLIQKKRFTIDVLQRKIQSNRQEYMREMSEYKREMEMIIEDKNGSIEGLEQSVRKLQREMEIGRLKWQKQISQIKEQLKSKTQIVQKLQREMFHYNRQVQTRYREYQKGMQRLRQQISTNLLQFQQGKRNLRQIYEKLMSEKMQEQAEGFNSLLRGKEEEKERLQGYYHEREEEYERELREKGRRIEEMGEELREKRGEITKWKDEVQGWKKVVKEIENQVENSRKTVETYKLQKEKSQQQLKTKQNYLKQQQLLYLNQLQLLNKNKSQAEHQLKLKILNLQKQYHTLNQHYQEKSQTLKTTQKTLATIERKHQRILQEHLSKWLAEKEIIERRGGQLQALLDQKENLIKHKIQQLTQLALKHQQDLQNKDQLSAKQLQNLKQTYQQQLNLLNSSTSQQLAFLKKQHQKILAQQKFKNNQQLKLFQQQLFKKLSLKQQQFTSLRTQLQNQLNQKTIQLQNHLAQITDLKLQKQQVKKLLEDTQLKHKLEIQKVKAQSENSIKEMTKQFDQQKKKIQQEMVNQLMEFQMEMEKKSAQYQNNLEKIQSEMMKEINLLKSSNALEQLEAKYISQMDSLKKEHEQQLVSMEQKQKQSQQSLIQEQKRHIQRLIQQYEEDMTKLAKKLQTDIQSLNTQLFQEQKEHEITKMTRQEKIKYLSKKINELKILSQKKENQILELQLQIQEYEKEHDKMNQIIESKVNIRKNQLQVEKNDFIKQCQISVQKSRNEALKKVSQVEKDRLEHSHSMYQKFNQLKQLHEEQLNRLQSRYSELEKLFAERPSRAEDLTKIKELIEIKEKMDIEMKTCHKKVEHANEIVKYLNLELQNYKDTYDMFGPGEESPEKPVNIESNSSESPMQSIIKLRRINYRINTEGSESIYSSQDKYQTTTPKINNLRISNDSPSFREFQLYPGNKLNQSITIMPPIEAQSINKNLYNKKSPQMIVNNRIKKASSIDKSGEIVLNAQNFLKLINDNPRNGSIVRESKSIDRRAYRKSKPRRLNTLAYSNGQTYSIARRQSIDQQSPLK